MSIGYCINSAAGVVAPCDWLMRFSDPEEYYCGLYGRDLDKNSVGDIDKCTKCATICSKEAETNSGNYYFYCRGHWSFAVQAVDKADAARFVRKNYTGSKFIGVGRPTSNDWYITCGMTTPARAVINRESYMFLLEEVGSAKSAHTTEKGE